MGSMKRKLITITQVIGILLAVGSSCVLISVLLHLLVKAMGYEFRTEIKGLAWTAFMFYGCGFFGCIIWLLATLYSDISKKKLRGFVKKISCFLGMVTCVLAIGVVLVLGYIYLAYLSEEKSAIIDGETYIARIETTGMETTGISYHRRVNFALCEIDGWLEPFDYELWSSYTP